MAKLTEEQLMKLRKNLRVGKCPNCGYEGNKDLSPREMHLVSLNVDPDKTVDFSAIGSLPVVMACCPNCGYISLFNRKFLCD